jgi:hypothetical protein
VRSVRRSGAPATHCFFAGGLTALDDVHTGPVWLPFGDLDRTIDELRDVRTLRLLRALRFRLAFRAHVTALVDWVAINAAASLRHRAAAAVAAEHPVECRRLRVLYGMLALAVGQKTTAEHVHAMWSRIRSDVDPADERLVPFGMQHADHQAYCRSIAAAIRRAALTLDHAVERALAPPDAAFPPDPACWPMRRGSGGAA